MGRDRAQIAREIDAYNAANKTISENYKVSLPRYYIHGQEKQQMISHCWRQMACIHPPKNISGGQKNLPIK
jgi:hypothetical protein